MIVHFIAPSSGYKQKVDVIRRIQNAVMGQGHKLTHSTAADSSTMLEMGLGILDKEEWELLYKRDMSLLGEADIAIFECSNKATFGVGYLAAHALMLGKPTLLLLDKDGLGGSFTVGLTHAMLTRKFYTEYNVEKNVSEFLEGLKQ